MIYGLSNSGNSDDLEWHPRSFTYFKPFQMRLFVQLGSGCPDFNYWHSASRGSSAIAKLLVSKFSGFIENSMVVLCFSVGRFRLMGSEVTGDIPVAAPSHQDRQIIAGHYDCKAGQRSLFWSQPSRFRPNIDWIYLKWCYTMVRTSSITVAWRVWRRPDVARRRDKKFDVYRQLGVLEGQTSDI